MSKHLRIKKLLPTALAGCAMVCMFSCQKIKRLVSEPPPQGVIQESYTMRFTGYKRTATVKASMEELTEYISDPRNLGIKMLQSEKQDRPIGSLLSSPVPAGTSLPLKLKVMGLNIKAHNILVKSDMDNRWMVIDNPYVFVIVRLALRPGNKRTRITIIAEYEIPERGVLAQLGKVVDFEKVATESLKEMDQALTRVQAHFDPDMDPDEVLALGLQGESYQTLFQVYESRVWVDASPREVEEWLARPENTPLLLQGLRAKSADQDYLTIFHQTPVGEVIYFPAVMEGPLKVELDTFNVKESADKITNERLYWTGPGIVGMMLRELQPEAGGTGIRWKFISEMPGPMSPAAMDLMFTLAQVPKRMQEMMMQIKTGVEKLG